MAAVMKLDPPIAETSSGDHDRTMYPALPDALADALGCVVAEARHDARKDFDALAFEQRAILAEYRAEILQLRHENDELRRSLKDTVAADVAAEIAKLREAAAAVKDGAPGEAGPPGPPPDYGVVLERAEPLMRSLLAARWDDWTATLPLPERGEKGDQGERGERGQDADHEAIAEIVLKRLPPPERGEPGSPGRDVDPEQVRAMIAEQVAQLPPAERGEPGQPGKDADPDLIELMVEEAVRRSMPEPLPGPQGERGPPGQDVDPSEIVERVLGLLPPPERGAQGEPGRSISEIKRVADELLIVMSDGSTFSAGLVRGERGEAGPAGPAGQMGPPGEPGRDGRDVDLDHLERMVAEKVSATPVPADVLMRMVDDAVALIPRPQDGERGPPGEPADPAMIEALVAEKVAALPPPEKGEKGDPGESIKGDPGPPGRDGVGVAGALIDRAGELIVTLSDGTVRNLGPIVGKDGAPGMPGKDGLSFDAFKLHAEYDGERTITLRWLGPDGQEQMQKWRLPITLDRGVYRPDTAYEPGDVVSFGGSMWIAKTDTKDKPGNGNDTWRLSVKHGRDGRDGATGEKGERGPEGRPGRDFVAGKL